MDELLLELSEEAIIRYFTTLSQFGYKKYSSVNKLLLLIFLEEFLTGPFLQYLTEKDYREITNCIYCLVGSDCMIDFPIFEVNDGFQNINRRNVVFRITEDDILRITENGFLRIEA